MVNKNIHGVDVTYNEESDTTKAYLDHLEYSVSHEELRAFIDSAKHNPLHKTHLEDKYGNQFTLEYKSDYNCLLRKRQY